MMLKKIMFVFFLNCGLFSVAQNRLDDIHLNLPDEYDWETKPARYANDSTQRIQARFLKDESGKNTLGVIIGSRDKSVIKTDFKGAQKENLSDLNQGEKISLLAEEQLEGNYPFALYKVLLNDKEEGKPGSYLMAMLETKTAMHTLFVRGINLDLSKKFVKTWSEILKNPVIEPAKTKTLQQTKIVLSTTKPEALKDNRLRDQLLQRFQDRLQDKFAIRPEDLQFKNGKITLKLRGNVDLKKIKQVLNQNSSFQIFPLFRNKDYKTFVETIDKQMAPQIEGYQSWSDSQFAYFGAISRENEKSMVTLIDNLLTKQNFPKGVKLTTGPEPGGDNSILLYLVDTQKKIVNETNINNVNTAFGANGYRSLQMEFDDTGKEKIALWTRQHKGEYLAILIDGKVWSAPILNTEIPGGRIEISSYFTLEEVKKMENAIHLTYPIPITVESVKVLE